MNISEMDLSDIKVAIRKRKDDDRFLSDSDREWFVDSLDDFYHEWLEDTGGIDIREEMIEINIPFCCYKDKELVEAVLEVMNDHEIKDPYALDPDLDEDGPLDIKLMKKAFDINLPQLFQETVLESE